MAVELPLFPLHTVLCPGIAIPLHIFEDRYRALVRDCLEQGRPFGIVLIKAGREVGAGTVSFSAVGTVAEIREAEKYSDGRYDLLIVGTRRFAIERIVTEATPYIVAEVALLADEIRDETEAHRLAIRASRRFVRYLELLQPRDGETADEIDVRVEIETTVEPDDEEAEAVGDDPDAQPHRRVVIPDDPTVLSYLLAGILQVEAPKRQALLEAGTTEDRLRALIGLIDREVFLLRRRLRAFVADPRIGGARRS